jgi:hypothetical protein
MVLFKKKEKVVTPMPVQVREDVPIGGKVEKVVEKDEGVDWNGLPLSVQLLILVKEVQESNRLLSELVRLAGDDESS